MSGDAWPLAENTISMFFDNPRQSTGKGFTGQSPWHGSGHQLCQPAGVAGVCALLLEADPTLTHAQIKDILTSTATSDTIATGLPNNYWG